MNWFRYLGKIYGDEVLWLVDGAASINVIAKFEKSGLLTGSNATTPKFFSVFSSPELEARTNGTIMQNELLQKQGQRNLSQVITPNSAIFIGRCLRERSGVFQQDELQGLTEWANCHQGWHLNYVSHRHESPSKLKEIAKFMDVKTFSRSIGSELLVAEHLPEMIASWFSTALFTTNRLFPQVKLFSLHLPLQQAMPSQREECITVYHVLHSQGVEITGYAEQNSSGT